jgi:hypothetical protein
MSKIHTSSTSEQTNIGRRNRSNSVGRETSNQAQREEIAALCQELEELGGGIKTRLETITIMSSAKLLDNAEKLVDSQFMKYLSLHYNSVMCIYGGCSESSSNTKTSIEFNVVAKVLVEKLT